MKSFTGIPASYGVAIGPAFVFDRAEIVIETHSIEDPADEWSRFEDAREHTRQQLDEAYLVTKEDCGEEAAEIFNAQKLMLDDPELINAVKALVEKERINIEAALYETAEGYALQLEAINDEYLSARALDIRDVSHRFGQDPPTLVEVDVVVLGAQDGPVEVLVLDLVLAEDLGVRCPQGEKTHNQEHNQKMPHGDPVSSDA